MNISNIEQRERTEQREQTERGLMATVNLPIQRVLIAVPALALLLALGCSSGGQAGRTSAGAGSVDLQQLDELGQRLYAAIPERAVARPRRSRKILVFSRCEGYQHGAIPATAQLLTLMGQKTGVFEVVHSEEMEVFEADYLKQFDLVFFNNTTGLKFENQEYRRNLLEFVRNGKGVAGFHAAIDNFFTFPEAAEMMGGQFEDHPWTANGTWAIKIDEPDHPLNASFGGRAFLLSDEIYQVMGPFSRDIDRVLLSLDMSNLRNHQVTGIKRTDNDFPISWIRRYGEGRVFYSSLGHNIEVLMHKGVVGQYLAGIQYALGDLEVDDTPSNLMPVTPRPALTTEAGAVDDPFAVLVSWEDGHSRLPLAAIEAEIRTSTPEQHGAIETRLIEVLENPESTFTAKQFVCRMLRRIEPAESLPYLAGLLRDEELSNAARLALQGVESPEVDRILMEAIDELEGELLIGLIGTLGQRRTVEAVPRIAARLGNADPAMAGACITALGEIGSPEAAAALEDVRPPTGLESLHQDALLRCADEYLNNGAVPQAQAIYNRMASGGITVQTRVAAYRGLVHSQGAGAVRTLQLMLMDDELKIRQAAAGFMVELGATVDMTPIADQLSTLPPETQVMVLSSLAYNRTRGAAPAVVRALESSDPAVRAAALSALGDVGDASHVPLLARVATSDDEMADIAARSLARLDADGVNDRIIQLVRDGDDEDQVVLIGVLASRNMTEAVPVFLEFARDLNPQVRTESLRALALLAGDADLPALLDLLEMVPTVEDRIEKEKAILAVCERMEDREAGIDQLLAALTSKPSRVRASILTVLGGLPSDKSLAALTEATGAADDRIRQAAVNALSNWPDAEPLETLLNIARSSQIRHERSMAFAGVLRLAVLPNEREPAENERIFRAVLEIAQDAAEREMVLDAVAGVIELWVLNFIEPFLSDETTRKKADEVRRNVIEALAKTVSHDAVGCTVTLAIPYQEQYSGGGRGALTDGQWGSTDLRDGRWQGFSGDDLDAVVDLGRVMEIKSIRTGFLQEINSWVMLPTEVSYSVSTDGREYETVATFSIPLPDGMRDPSTETCYSELSGVSGRYVRVVAKNVGTLPAWHPGAGGRAWLFVDEIQINPHFDGERY